MITKRVVALTLLSISLFASERNESWMNPRIGFTGDFLADISDVEGEWSSATSEGLNIRAGELILGASIDPYAELTANINFGIHGAAIHELYANFPYLAGNMALSVGWKLAKWGRWNQFHTHSMPFSAEPRVYMEYFGGHFQGTGLELSWLAPTPFYFEATASVYDGINGHTHDSDPTLFESALDQKAAEMGLSKHGSHWHAADGSLVYEADLLDPNEPTTEKRNKSIGSFPIAGRLKSSLEFGSDFSLDLGASAVYQKEYRYSNRIDKSYSKGVFGADLTLFWHPLTMNKYRNFDIGAEWLANFEQNEQLRGDTAIVELDMWRQGVFSHVHYRHSARLHFGGYGEFFQAKEFDTWLRKRFGVFTTVEISHYQYLRLEASYYKQSPDLPPVHRLTLQYDVTIGFHSHGTQR